ncbi:hypothetical protein [Larkinella soli]|uniref:hypothetical protein n=1 Tax=Larkinella soli TaxID=1770527 RepID=UPI000FFB9F86|nr:hypothetical protein [Larkinella soli]
MKSLLRLLPLLVLLSGCVNRIELQSVETPVEDRDLPFKTLRNIGGFGVSADGGVGIALVRTASSRNPGSTDYSRPFLSRSEVLVVKTDSQGRTLWRKVVLTALDLNENVPLVHPVTDGGFLVFISTDVPQPKRFLLQLDGRGEVVWKREVQTPEVKGPLLSPAIYSVPGQGFAVVGRTVTTEGTGYSMALLRFDDRGTLLWNHAYPLDHTIFELAGVAPAPDGGLVLSWFSNNSPDVSWLMKTDASGHRKWLRRYALFSARWVQPTPEGGFALMAFMTTSRQNVLFYRLSDAGDIQQVRSFLPAENESVAGLLGFFPVPSGFILNVNTYPAGIRQVMIDFSGRETGRHLLETPSTFSPTAVLNGPDRSTFVLGRGSSGSVSLMRVGPEGVRQWLTDIPVGD